MSALVALTWLAGGAINWFTLQTVRVEAAAIVREEVCIYATPKIESAVRESRLIRAEADIKEIKLALHRIEEMHSEILRAIKEQR
jgi:hypothetical protein